MHIRPACFEERTRLVELWERSVRATHDFLCEEDIVALRPLVARELASAEIEWWVLASAADHPIGFIGHVNSRIEALFIDPDHQRRGGGRLLIAHAQRLAGGALAVDVNEQNAAAVRFYWALGFVVIRFSPMDSDGRPFPVLHMTRAAPHTLE